MKTIVICLSIITCFTISTLHVSAQNKQTTKADSLTKVRSKKEEKGRNVMLNAADNSGPREVNIGLPAQIGGTTIRENDVAAVYTYWPEMPNRAWRAGKALSRVGLLSINEATLTSGDFGYAISSYSRVGGDQFELLGNVTGNHFGRIKSDVNFSGPIEKNWSYTANIFANYDPRTYDLGFTDYSDRTQMFNFGLTKHFDNKKGKISFLYKYIQSVVLTNYAISQFEEGGEVTEFDNFKIGRDSYVIRSGQLHFLNALTGEYYDVNMGNSKDMNSNSHNFTVVGDYKFDNNWNLKYTARFRSAHTTAFTYVPMSITQAIAADNMTDMDGNLYVGDVQMLMVNHSDKTPSKTLQAFFELNKKINKHNIRIGLTEDYYNQGEYTFNRAFLFQEVAANPRQLTNYGASTTGLAQTDQYGFFNYNRSIGYYKGNENKVAAYFMDNLSIGKRIDLGIGGSIKYHSMDATTITSTRTSGFTIKDKDFETSTPNWVNLGANLNMVYKITKQFGINAQFLYSESGAKITNYALGSADEDEIKSPFLSFGVFLNHPKISLVSQVSYLTRNNFQNNLNLVNPDNPSDAYSNKVSFDIKTIGWSTDIIAKPFKNFSLHYRLTLQDPVYKNYSFEAFGQEYSYNGNNVVKISKVLMEIDPSLMMFKNKVRLWASVRYFSKQYANLTNVLFFKGWWETFGGVNYTVNKNINFGIKVVNPLNQRGVKNTISGAELATSPEPYYGSTIVSSYIMPFTMEASVNFKF